jgi:hypothetical protein
MKSIIEESVVYLLINVPSTATSQSAISGTAAWRSGGIWVSAVQGTALLRDGERNW